MNDFKLAELKCFDAVARCGGFQAAAAEMGRSHPSIFAAVARLEDRLGLRLLDRTGYRVALTQAGALFHARARSTLAEVDRLGAFADQLSGGEEAVLRVVIGDLCPRPRVLGWLSRFFATRPRTQLHLHYEAVGGPLERLLEGQTDLVFHRASFSEPRVETLVIGETALAPVAAPGFLPAALHGSVTPEQLRPYTQCILRDTARGAGSEQHFIIEGAHRCSAPDHETKKQIILHGMAWGHLPDFLVADELREGRLISLANRSLPGLTETLGATRRIDRPQGPVAEDLWRYIEGEARNVVEADACQAGGSTVG